MSSILIENGLDFVMLKDTFLVEIFFSTYILIILLNNLDYITDRQNNKYKNILGDTYIQNASLILFAIFLYFLQSGINVEEISFDSLIQDNSTKLSKIIFLVIALSLLFLLKPANLIQGIPFFEFNIFYLFIVLGWLLSFSANNLLMLYIIFELVTLCSYVLASIHRQTLFSVEAGIKYFISASFMGGFFLYGTSLIYGSIGTINFSEINNLLVEADNGSKTIEFFLTLGILLVSFTFLFKLAAAPFHAWSVEVYDGAPLASAITLSMLPKFPLIIVFFKWLNVIGDYLQYLNTVFVISGLLSIVISGLIGLKQTNIKKLFFYSSIGQMGYMCLGFPFITQGEEYFYIFFILGYMITLFQGWCCILILVYQGNYYRELNAEELYLKVFDKKNLGAEDIGKILYFVIFFTTTCGLPPLFAFAFKMSVFNAFFAQDAVFGFSFGSTNGVIFDMHDLVIPVLVAMASIQSMYFYIKVLKVNFFDNSQTSRKSKDFKKVYPVRQDLKESMYAVYFMGGIATTLMIYLLLDASLLINLSIYLSSISTY